MPASSTAEPGAHSTLEQRTTNMEFVHYDLGHQDRGTVVKVTLGSRAVVRLMDESNFRVYRSTGRYKFVGGEALRSPLPLEVPHSGRWHVAIDFNGGSGRVRSSVDVFPAAEAA